MAGLACVLVLLASVGVLSLVDESKMKIPELLTQHGYPHEVHYVTTEDGYILTMFRVLSKKQDLEKVNRPAIVLTHGLFSSAIDFVVLGPQNALAYYMVDSGFDVWIMNCRGSEYSRNHTTLRPNHSDDIPTFWNFSMHELGVYDLPSTVDYVINTTGEEKIMHLGMSQGANIFYIMLSERPEYNAKIRAHFSYAPAVFMCYTTNWMLKMVAQAEQYGTFSSLTRQVGEFNIAPKTPLFRNMWDSCNGERPDPQACSSVYLLLAPTHPSQLNTTLLPVLLRQYPEGASAKQVVHFFQIINQCSFCKYRPSAESPIVPYNLNNVKAPVYCFYGDYDYLVPPKSITLLESKLPNGFVQGVKVKDFGHLDFVCGIDAKRLVYRKTLKFMKKITRYGNKY